MSKDNKSKRGIGGKILMGLGIIFAIILIMIIGVVIFVMITKPFGVDITKIPQAITGTSGVTESSYDHPLLNEEQEIMLESLGVETTELPSAITPAIEECAVQKLGQERVDAIKAGAALTTTDYFKAGSCFQ